jgi:hypothetical protein
MTEMRLDSLRLLRCGAGRFCMPEPGHAEFGFGVSSVAILTLVQLLAFEFRIYQR